MLESALLLSLLTKERLAAREACSAHRYLKHVLATSPPDRLQHHLAQAAMGEKVLSGEAIHDAMSSLSSFQHFSSHRKLLTFQTLFAELGSPLAPDTVPIDAYEVGDQQIWLKLQMSALKVMAMPEAATDSDWARLTPVLQRGPVWQANHFARLLGLLALRKHHAHRPAVRRTLARVATEQLPGGGLPFVTDVDIFATAIAGTALARSTHLGDPRLTTMADALAAGQHHDGGFGFATQVSQSDVDSSSYALEFLRAATPGRHFRAIAQAEKYLIAQRNLDGGFPTFVRGTPSEIAMTAGAVNALAPNPAYRDETERGVAFLVDAGPVVERSWSRSVNNAVFRATLAYGTLTSQAPVSLRLAAHDARHRCRQYLADTQQPDGGWGHKPGDASDPISTAYAVIALTDAPEHASVLNQALGYLLAQQQPDGGYRSRPDQAGPRPLLYDIPALADITTLLALSTEADSESDTESMAT
ncbi:prenyltransferase/squalene oxidase repeat-containing protein [Streptomyces sp. NPDC127068]|uniref:prenyltransferase/squalene oxidase repeat-containing protein n=1 Tax=Streptomyces sp. NPDC127068 TaxID=3347127 RepID=UPI0036567D69